MNIFTKFLSAAVIFFLISGISASAGVTEGAVAYQRKDYAVAYKEFLSAAEQGSARAQNYLAIMYDEGQGVAQDHKQAGYWLQKAAEQGLAQAQYNFGNMYRTGQGVAQDYKQAIVWYRKAAEQGVANAQLNLGLMYAKGQGVAQDDKQAVAWFSKAAEQGDVVAQSNLGVRYVTGQGVAQNYKLAHMWFNIAGSNGNKRAVKLRDLIAKSMTAEQISKAQGMARNWIARHTGR